MSALSDKIAAAQAEVTALAADVDAAIAELATLKTSSFTQADLDAVDALGKSAGDADTKLKAAL